MAKKELSKAELIEKFKELSKDTKAPLNESNTKNSTIYYFKKAVDNRIYGIIRENTKYFIKVASGKKENPNAADFAYIGGLMNKLDERYDSYHDALKRLNFKMLSLNEAYSSSTNEIEEEGIPLNKDIDKEKEDTTPKETEAIPEVKPEVSAPAPEEAPVSTETAPIDTTPEETPTETAPTNTETSNDDSKEGGDEKSKTASEIQSLLGKLTQKYAEYGEVDEPMAKTGINSIISATKAGISQMDDEEKNRISKRIEKNGEKIEEEVSPEEEKIQVAQALSESIKSKKFNSLVKKIVKEEVEKIENDKIGKIIDSLTEHDFEDALDSDDDYDDQDNNDKIDYNHDCIIALEGHEYSVKCAGKHMGKFNDWETAEKCVTDWKAANHNPKVNTWFVSDQNEAILIDDSESEEEPVEIHHNDDEDEDNMFMEHIKNIQEESKKHAINFIKEKYSSKVETLNEDSYSLDEASLGDIFNKAGLGKVFDKAKGFFSAKGVNQLLNSDPKLKSTYDTAVQAITTLKKGDESAWAKFVGSVRMPLLKVIMAIMILNGTIGTAFAQKLEQDNLAPKGTTELVVQNQQIPGEGTADKEVASEKSLDKLLTNADISSMKILKHTPHHVTVAATKEIGGSETVGKAYVAPKSEVQKLNRYAANGKFDPNKTATGKDSEEVGEKYAWIKEHMSKLPSDTTQFDQGFQQVQKEYANRFKDSELTMKDGTVLYTHRFLDNDNYAQGNYKTTDGKFIKQGEKIPQNTKVIDFYGGDVVTEKGTTPTESQTQEENYSQLTTKPITIEKDIVKEQKGVYKELKQQLTKLGFTYVESAKYITINTSNFWVKSDNLEQTINSLNKEIEELGKPVGINLSNLFRAAEQVDINAAK